MDQEQTESMKSLSAFLHELSKQMVHQMSVIKDGSIHIDVTVENSVISQINFNTQNEIKI